MLPATTCKTVTSTDMFGVISLARVEEYLDGRQLENKEHASSLGGLLRLTGDPTSAHRYLLPKYYHFVSFCLFGCSFRLTSLHTIGSKLSIIWCMAYYVTNFGLAWYYMDVKIL